MSSWTSGICNFDGIDIHYLRSGGNKPPIVLLHGLMTSGACLFPVARLLQKDFDVILPDSRGHGNSSAPKDGYTYKTLAEDVSSLLKHLKIEKTVLVGHSMGGMTATVLASKYPHVVKKLILADPAFLTPMHLSEVASSDLVKKHQEVLNLPKEEFLKQKIIGSSRSKELLELLVEARFQTSIHAFKILNLPYPKYQPLIKSISSPTLLITPETSPVISSEMIEELLMLNPKIHSLKIKNAGHGLIFDQPDLFSQMVCNFL